MARKLATTEDITVGATVYTSRTGQVSRTVTAVEPQPDYPEAGPVVYAQREGRYMETAHPMSELWVEAR